VAGKPEPPLLLEAIARAGSVRPLMIGDRLDTDIAGALRVGIPGIWLRHEGAELLPDIVPTHIIRSLDALPGWLAATSRSASPSSTDP